VSDSIAHGIALASRTCDASAIRTCESYGNERTETDERSGLVTVIYLDTAVDACARIEDSTTRDER
jgi:hypothetical protein